MYTKRKVKLPANHIEQEAARKVDEEERIPIATLKRVV